MDHQTGIRRDRVRLGRRTNGGKWGLIGSEGAVIIEPLYETFDSFWYGLAKVQHGGKWGFIDTTGKVVISPEFETATNFLDGLAIVRKEKAGVIDLTGKTVIPFEYDYIDRLTAGFRVWKDKKCGFVNAGGKLIVPVSYSNMQDYGDSKFAQVSRNGKWGIVDSRGIETISTQFDIAVPLADGSALVKKDGKWGLLTPKGSIMINIQYDDISRIGDIWAVKADGKLGFRSLSGKLITAPQFDELGFFRNGMARVKKGGKYGYVNMEGRIVIEPQFDGASDFSECMARVEKGGKEGYVSIDGTVTELIYDKTSSFENGTSYAQLNGKWGIIRNIVPPAKQEKVLEQAGELIGSVRSISPAEVIVGGADIGGKVRLGDRLCVYAGEKIVVLTSTFPMQTVTKCSASAENRKILKPGMKVYRYSKPEQTK